MNNDVATMMSKKMLLDAFLAIPDFFFFGRDAELNSLQGLEELHNLALKTQNKELAVAAAHKQKSWKKPKSPFCAYRYPVALYTIATVHKRFQASSFICYGGFDHLRMISFDVAATQIGIILIQFSIHWKVISVGRVVKFKRFQLRLRRLV